MELKKLLTAYEAVDMLHELGLPVSDEQQKAITDLEKNYISENIIPTIKSEIEPFLSPLRGNLKINVTFSPKNGLAFSIGENSQKDAVFNDEEAQSLDRTKYSIDGGMPLNKRRFVLTVVKKYVESHPEATYQDLEKRFPSNLSNSALNGVVRKYEDILMRLQTHPDLRKRFFLDPEDIITLIDGTKVVVFNQWRGESIQNFLTVARKLHEIKVFE